MKQFPQYSSGYKCSRIHSRLISPRDRFFWGPRKSPDFWGERKAKLPVD